jgi:SAM-dependent methyltransferase
MLAAAELARYGERQMRHEIVKVFETVAAPKLRHVKAVAVVGGSRREPELCSLHSQVLVDYFGIANDDLEPNFEFLDLNHRPTKAVGRYDLVLCSQVLEHVWDVRAAIDNLVNLTSPGGFLWIGCPTSNFPHGSPHYYSAGYTSELIVNLLEQSGVEVIDSGMVGSERNYVWTHAHRHWPSEAELARPLRASVAMAFHSGGSLPKRLLRCARRLTLFPLLTTDATVVSDVRFATESWVLGRLPSTKPS